MNDSKSSPNSRIAPHISALPKSGIRDFFDIVATMDHVISLGVGEPDFTTPWHIRESTIYALNKGATHYTSNLGDLKLRREICRYSKENFGAEFNPNTECIVTVGVSEGLDILLRAIISPGDEIIYHEPSYVSYAPSIRMAHGVPVCVETHEENGFVPTVADLEKVVTQKTKALLINFPNNPTGGTMTPEQKQEIADFVIRHDLLLISDEIYEEVTYTERTDSIVALPGMHDRSVLLNGFSKSFAMTGYRIAYALGPHDIIDAMMKIHQYSMLCAPIMAQMGALEALLHGKQQRLAMLEEYEQRRNLITARLNAMGLKCPIPKGAFYVFPSIKSTGMTSMEFAKRLLSEKHVAVIPGTAFGSCGEGYIRCSYATGMKDIEKAMDLIADFLEGK